MGKHNARNGAKPIPAVRHFIYRERKKHHLYNLHEYACEMDAKFGDLIRKSEDKLMDLPSKQSNIANGCRTQMLANGKNLAGQMNINKIAIPADRHLNYRRARAQHEFSLHEYVAEREEMIRSIIREREEMWKDFKDLDELSKDAELLANEIGKRVDDDGDLTKPLIITSTVDGKPLSVEDLFQF